MALETDETHFYFNFVPMFGTPTNLISLASVTAIGFYFTDVNQSAGKICEISCTDFKSLRSGNYLFIFNKSLFKANFPPVFTHFWS